MKLLRTVCLTLLALFALGAFVASTASAEEGTLPQQGTNIFTVVGSGEAILENVHKEVLRCKSFGGEGTFVLKSAQKATGTLTFTGCSALGFNANTLGAATGVIKTKVAYLVCLVNPADLLFGVLIEFTESPVHVEVPALMQLILIKGAIIAHNLSVNAGEAFLFDLVGLGGEQKQAKECEINGKQFMHTLLYSVDTKEDAASSFEAHALVIYTAKVELMDT